MSGGQCHLIHLTIRRRFSWSSLAYVLTKWSKTPFISFRDVRFGRIKTVLTLRGLTLPSSILPCKTKRQYLLTCKVSRYCLLALHGSIVGQFSGLFPRHGFSGHKIKLILQQNSEELEHFKSGVEAGPFTCSTDSQTVVIFITFAALASLSWCDSTIVRTVT